MNRRLTEVTNCPARAHSSPPRATLHTPKGPIERWVLPPNETNKSKTIKRGASKSANPLSRKEDGLTTDTVKPPLCRPRMPSRQNRQSTDAEQAPYFTDLRKKGGGFKSPENDLLTTEGGELRIPTQTRQRKA